MRDAFYFPKILNARAILTMWHFDACAILWEGYFIENGRQFPVGNYFNWHFNFFVLLFLTFIFDSEASALTWSNLFRRVWNMPKWSPVHHAVKVADWNQGFPGSH